MKKFTIVSSLFFVLLFCGMIGYVALSEDFTAPRAEEKAEEEAAAEEENMDAPVWSRTMDELVAYLEEKGLIATDTKQVLATSGLCSAALKYNGAEIYWWDVEKLDPKSEEYQAYDSLRTKGEIDLWGSGSIIMPKRNGPFALSSTSYEGDVDALEKAFEEFGQEN